MQHDFKGFNSIRLTQSVVGTATNPFNQRTYVPTEASAEHAAHDTLHWAINFAYNTLNSKSNTVSKKNFHEAFSFCVNDTLHY